MRVGIDCSPLLLQSAGVKTYLHHLVRELQALRGPSEVSAVPYLQTIPDLDHRGSGLSAATTYARLVGIALVNRRILPAASLSPKVDLFHTTSLLRRHPKKCRLTVTIHDATAFLFPELHTPATLKAEHRFFELATRADGVLASSQNTKRDVMRILKIREEKVHVVHLGAARSYFDVTTEAAREAQERYRLKKPYLLFVSTIEPRKNLERLIDAYEQLTVSLREQFDLVVAGPAGWRSDATMERLRNPRLPGLRYLAYVPERDMPGLFAGATLFVYPSLYEGFGLPVVQAMAAGTPVATTEAGALPEVGGEAVAYLDPLSASAIAETLTELLTSPTKLQRLATAGRLRAECFHWSQSARQTWSIFEQVVGG